MSGVLRDSSELRESASRIDATRAKRDRLIGAMHRFPIYNSIVISMLFLSSCAFDQASRKDDLLQIASADGCSRVPRVDDWSPAGTAITQGIEGDFDLILWGGFGGSVIRWGDETLLYYQGSTHYSGYQQSVANRSIGLAISSDGRNFRKYTANPVLRWLPTGGEEEGATSLGITEDTTREILVAFYGANTRTGDKSVSTDGRWAASTDGRTFVDKGVALNHQDPGLFGAGDEIFPIIAIQHRSSWYVYYLPNGSPQKSQLGVAWGPRPDNLSRNAGVTAEGKAVRAWGMGSAANLCGDIFAIFLNHVHEHDRTMTVHLADLRSPHQFSRAIATYHFADVATDFAQGAVLLDRDLGVWHLYFRTASGEAYKILQSKIVPR